MAISPGGTSYNLTGPEEAPVITLVHGIGVKRQLWADFETRLSRKYRVLSYDLLGHGESTRPDSNLTLGLFSDQLNELLEELAIDKTVIIGFSMGGMIIRRFAMSYPGRTSAIVVMNSPHRRDKAAQKLVERRARDTSAGGPAATIDESMARWFTPEFLGGTSPIISKIRQWILANDPRSYLESRQILAGAVHELVDPNPALSLPALVITCENDHGSTPEMAFAIGADIPGSETVTIPRLQHLGMLEDPDAFLNPIETFLGRLNGF